MYAAAQNGDILPAGYRYDHQNRRARKLLPDGTAVNYHHDAAGHLIAESDEIGAMTRFSACVRQTAHYLWGKSFLGSILAYRPPFPQIRVRGITARSDPKSDPTKRSSHAA